MKGGFRFDPDVGTLTIESDRGGFRAKVRHFPLSANVLSALGPCFEIRAADGRGGFIAEATDAGETRIHALATPLHPLHGATVTVGDQARRVAVGWRGWTAPAPLPVRVRIAGMTLDLHRTSAWSHGVFEIVDEDLPAMIGLVLVDLWRREERGG